MAEPVVLRCREHGPLVIPRGAFKIIDHQGNEFPQAEGKELIALCRCGQSGKKPFCDGTHKAVGFQAAELAPSASPETPA